MFERLEPYFQHSDQRGSIQGLINKGEWREVNLIKSESGAIRGRHYHKTTLECFVILQGVINVEFRKPISSHNNKVIFEKFKGGDVFIVKNYVEHTFNIVESAMWINLLSKPLDSLEPDFFKY
jgi:dTDP-4-dehydrorhamnose 3,5-epimerase-like enzyme